MRFKGIQQNRITYEIFEKSFESNTNWTRFSTALKDRCIFTTSCCVHGLSRPFYVYHTFFITIHNMYFILHNHY